MPTNPPPVIEADLALITQRLVHSGVGRTAEVTFAFRNDAGANAQTVINGFQTIFNGHITPLFDTNVTAEPPYVALGQGDITPSVAVATGASAVGARTILSLPSAVALLAKKTTGLGGKRNRGRTYFPWMLATADITESGQIIAPTIATVQNELDDVLTASTAAQLQMVIANKILAPSPIGHDPYVESIDAGPNVTQWTCESFVATQRRRQPRG
jgi:hypothetical protein